MRLQAIQCIKSYNHRDWWIEQYMMLIKIINDLSTSLQIKTKNKKKENHHKLSVTLHAAP